MARSGKSLYEWCIENNKFHLLSEWDVEKNGTTTPKDIGYGSVKEIWWVCPNGHSYIAKPNSRTANGSGCPYCSHQKMKTGYNDLQTVYPKVAKFWDAERNGITPDQVIAGSHKKAWWKCEKGHSWQSTINSKINDHHCPFCSGRIVLKGENDLETLFPELVTEWNYEKNKILPSEISVSSSRKVWWKCKKCGTEWQSIVSNRTRDNGDTGSGCPQCTKELSVSFPEKVIYHYISQYFNDTRENIGNDYFNWLGKMSIDIYIPCLKIGIEYDGGWHKPEIDLRKNMLCYENGIDLIRVRDSRLPSLNSTSYDFVVENRNEIDLKKAIIFIFDIIKNKHSIDIDCDIDINRDRGLVYQAMNLQQKENSLLSVNPLLAQQWNYEKNLGLRPDVVSANSHKKVWWKCEKGHEWVATVAARNRGGTGCPMCAGKKPQEKHLPLSIERPDVLRFWDNEKNTTINPQKITMGSQKKVFWKCPDCGNEWVSRIVDMKGCPLCKSILKIQSRQQMELTTIPENMKDITVHPLINLAFSNNKYNRVINEWDETKNGASLTANIVVNVYKKYWWKCGECGFEWQTTIEKRIGRGQNCPACKGKSVHEGFNDLLTTRPDLAKEWHPHKNGDLLPTMITKGSSKKVWWYCYSCNNEWQSMVKDRNAGRGCPKCAKLNNI